MARLPPSCITLSGIRGSAKAITTPTSRIKRLYPGDLLFLFFFEKMGIFRILGRLLDDFAFNGKYPMNTADSSNELTWIIMETMVRQTKTGLSSTVRDRNSAYRRGLGWEIDEEESSDRIRKPTLRLATYSTSLSKMHSFTITTNDWQLQFAELLTSRNPLLQLAFQLAV